MSIPGWTRVLEYAAARVNDEIVLATRTENVSDVIRWNGKRQLLDDMLAYVNDTRKQRDEILAVEKEIKEQMNGGSGY